MLSLPVKSRSRECLSAASGTSEGRASFLLSSCGKLPSLNAIGRLPQKQGLGGDLGQVANEGVFSGEMVRKSVWCRGGQGMEAS